jgi:hypothetical protein
MADKEKIMDKIRALLEKTVENGATEQEAIEAAKMAQRLMSKYKIQEITTETPETIDSTEMEISRKWQAYLADTLAKNLCCRCVISHGKNKTRFVVMGKESDRDIFQKMFESFFIMIYKGIQAEKAKAKEMYGHARDVETSYAVGFIQAVGDAMGEQCRALALVVPEEVNEATRERFPHLRKGRAISYGGNAAATAANRNGYSDGRSAASQKRLTA